jgi:ethanolamine ammonia-lyase large subunit
MAQESPGQAPSVSDDCVPVRCSLSSTAHEIEAGDRIARGVLVVAELSGRELGGRELGAAEQLLDEADVGVDEPSTR